MMKRSLPWISALGFGALALLGCGSDDESRPAPSEPASEERSPAPEEVRPVSPEQAPRERLDPALRRRFRTELPEARRLAHAGEHAAALERFERMVEEMPNNPRLRCEAGFVASQAGEDRRAALHLDVGLGLMGDGSLLAPAMTVPMAMCLYNRGLVHQSEGELRAAARRFRKSLALRPNSTVQQHLDEVTAELGGALPRELEAASLEALTEAMAHRYCGGTCLEEEDECSSDAEVQVLARRAGTDEFPEVALLTVRSPGCMLDDILSVVAIRGEGERYHLRLLFEDSEDNTDHGVWGGGGVTGAEGLSVVRQGDVSYFFFVVRYGTTSGYQVELEPEDEEAEDADVSCYVDAEGQTREVGAVLCRAGESPECGFLRTATRSTGAVHAFCSALDEEGEERDVQVPAWARSQIPSDAPETSSDEDFEVRLDADPEVGGLRVRTVRGETPNGLARASVRASELLELMTTLEPLEVRPREGESEGEGEGEGESESE